MGILRGASLGPWPPPARGHLIVEMHWSRLNCSLKGFFKLIPSCIPYVFFEKGNKNIFKHSKTPQKSAWNWKWWYLFCWFLLIIWPLRSPHPFTWPNLRFFSQVAWRSWSVIYNCPGPNRAGWWGLDQTSCQYGCFLKWWYPHFTPQNDHF